MLGWGSSLYAQKMEWIRPTMLEKLFTVVGKKPVAKQTVSVIHNLRRLNELNTP